MKLDPGERSASPQCIYDADRHTIKVEGMVEPPLAHHEVGNVLVVDHPVRLDPIQYRLCDVVDVEGRRVGEVGDADEIVSRRQSNKVRVVLRRGFPDELRPGPDQRPASCLG